MTGAPEVPFYKRDMQRKLENRNDCRRGGVRGMFEE